MTSKIKQEVMMLWRSVHSRALSSENGNKGIKITPACPNTLTGTDRTSLVPEPTFFAFDPFQLQKPTHLIEAPREKVRLVLGPARRLHPVRFCLLFPATSQCQKLKGTHRDSRGRRGQSHADPSVQIHEVAFPPREIETM